MCFRPMRYSPANGIRRRQGGYVLVIMLVIVVAGSLYSLLDRLGASAADTSRVDVTNQALKQAREALLAYAATYPDRNPGEGFGYLPCPDMAGDDGIGSMIGTGAGSVHCQAAVVIGLLPHRSLGLSELRDGDGNCLWYAVSNTHKANPKYAAAPSETSTAQFRILDATGIVLLDNAAPGAGAAAVVIAPGPPVAGQSRQTKMDRPCATDSDQAAAYLESLGPTFTNGTQKDAEGAILKNDQLSWITVQDTLSLARKRTDYKADQQ